MKTRLLLLVFCIFQIENTFAQTELITNGDFSNGYSGWTTSGNWHITTSFSCYKSYPGYAYAGDANGNAVINETGDLKQTFTIPSNATSATLTFHASKNTDEVAKYTAWDYVNVYLLNSNGNQIYQFSPTNIDNLYSGKPVTDCDGYSPKSFTIDNSFFGQTLQLDFYVHSDGGPNNTMFRIDDVSLLATVPASTGSVNVTISPSGAVSAGALWNIDNGSWQNSGTTLSNISTGNHTIYYNSITDWTGCNNQSISVSANQTTYVNSCTYQQNAQYGSVNVTISPSGAVSAGALWNIDGGSWQNSETTLNNITTGNHTINFNTISGWTTPSSQSISVTNGNTNYVNSSYTQNATYGSVNVTISPSAAVSAGALWNIDNGSWQNSGTTVNNITTGNHTINFNTISGWTSASSQSINVTSGNTNYLTGTYKQNTITSITINSPNGGENLISGETHLINATFSSDITGIEIYYSIDGGASYPFYIIGLCPKSNIVTIPWIVPRNSSNNCKIKIKGISGNSIITDESDAAFIISSSDGQTFELNSSLSHLFWPFYNHTDLNSSNPESNWINRNGWISGTEDGKGGGSGHGEGGHHGVDYFADDWNNGKIDCGLNFYAPLDGEVIFVKTYCLKTCVSDVNSCGGYYTNNKSYGNQVIIRSSLNTNFAFRVAHLNDVMVSIGQHVKAGDLIGTIGGTGASTEAHTHCVLYQRINETDISLNGESVLSRLLSGSKLNNDTSNDINKYKADFLFNAVTILGSGGENSDTTQLIAKALGSTSFCTGDSVLLEAIPSKSYYWSTGDTSSKIVVKNSGVYSVTILDSLNNYYLSDPFIINALDHPTFKISTKDNKLTLCGNDSLILFANSINAIDEAELEGNNLLYNWSNGSSNDFIVVYSEGTYFVNAANSCGSASDQITISTGDSPPQPIVQLNENHLASNTINGASYQWFYNGQLINGATSQYFNADSIGYYSVSAINLTNHCTSTSDPVYVEQTGIPATDDSHLISLYPNPAKNKCFLKLNSLVLNKRIQIRIYDSFGHCVLQDQIISSNLFTSGRELNLTSMNNGIYLVQVTLDNKIMYFKKVTIIK